MRRPLGTRHVCISLGVVVLCCALTACDADTQRPLPSTDLRHDGDSAQAGDVTPDTRRRDLRDDTGRLDTGADTRSPEDTSARDAPDTTDGSSTDLDADAAPDAFDMQDTADTSSPWGTCEVDGEPGVCLDVAECDGGRVTTPGLCPGPTNIRCCHEPTTSSTCDPTVMTVPQATFVEAGGDAGCPDGMARVDTFCIDRYEAVLVEVLADGSTRPFSPFFNPESRTVRALSVADAVPQGYITGDQAAAACAEAGKRLCTDTEWLRACQGAAGNTYPYGDTRQDGVCNDARSQHPVVEYFGTTEDWIWSELGHPCISQQDDTVARTGAHTGCVTADGVYDMMGNLHEWTADPSGTFRGGFYVDTVVNGEGCLYATTAHSTGHWDYSTGFRCCADVQ